MRSIWLLLTLLFITGMVACKKEDKIPDNPGTNDMRLQGRWEAFKSISVAYKNDQEISRDTFTYPAGERIFEFKGDSLLVYGNDGPSDERFTYMLIGNELLVRSGVEGYFFAIRWYQDKQMSLTVDQTRVNSSGKSRDIEETFYDKIP